MESLKKSSEKFILRDGLMEPYPSDETFISLDLFTAIEWNDTNRYLIEFMASRWFIEKDSEYSQLDFRKDILEYFTNYSYDQFKYIKVCTPFVTWYTRLVTLRDEYGYLYTWSSIRDSDYFQKNMLEIEPAIKKNIITVQEIEEKIWYLVHKYFQNSPIVINDFNEFIWILRNKYWE